jgi:hypothetical protein
MRRRNALERQAYRAESERLRAAARSNPKDKEDLLLAAADLERFSRTMPQPMTLRQSMIDQLTPSHRLRSGGFSKDSEIEHDR